MPEFQGIDVSKHQGVVDWKKVKAAGKTFAFIRIGWAGWAGEFSEDIMFKTNMSGAISSGLNVGVYFYSYCKTAVAAQKAAQACLKAVAPYELTMPIAFDIEDTSDAGTRYDLMSKTLNNSIVSAFLDEIQKAGYYGLIYTYKAFASSFLDMSKLTAYDVWIAQYNTACTYTGKYGIWQYRGDTLRDSKGNITFPGGKCDGVIGDCDLNVSYKDYPTIIRGAGLNKLAPAAADIPVAPTIPAGYVTQSEHDKVVSENATLKAEVQTVKTKYNSLVASLKDLAAKY